MAKKENTNLCRVLGINSKFSYFFLTLKHLGFKKPVLRISFKSWFYLSQNVGRYVDRIIGFQILVNCIQMPVSLSFLCGMWWIKDLSYFITKKGCYIATFFGFFQVNYMQCHSFFTCLFRYICILHPDKLSKFGSNAPKVSIVICEL